MKFLCTLHNVDHDGARNKRTLTARLVRKLTELQAWVLAFYVINRSDTVFFSAVDKAPSTATSSGGPAAASGEATETASSGIPSSGAPSPRLLVYVQHGDATITLDVSASYPTRVIKAKIQAMLGIATALQRLTYEDEQLEDGLTLEHYNIRNRSTLFLYVEGEEEEEEAADDETPPAKMQPPSASSSTVQLNLDIWFLGFAYFCLFSLQTVVV